MQKKSRRPREKVLSMALMLVMLVLGILCFLTPLSTLVGVQYLAFGCLAIYGAVMVARYIGSEHKSKFLLLGGVACFLLSAAPTAASTAVRATITCWPNVRSIP